MFVKNKYTQDASVIAFEPRSSALKRIAFRFRRYWETGGAGYFTHENSIYNGFTPPTTPSGLEPFSQLPDADIVSLNWVSGFWDYRLISRLSRKCKVAVWRLSDMNPFTGGCLYDNNCGRFIENCGLCPCLKSSKTDDPSRRSIGMKKKIIESLPEGFLHIVAQSRWIEDQIKASYVFGGLPIARIPNGVNVEQLKPRDPLKARKEFGIHPEHAVIMFVAQSLSNPRKGGVYFKEALNRMAANSTRPITVLALGRDALPPIKDICIVQVQHVTDEARLSLCYSAADVYVITSLQDNLPNTVLEAMACGTPVVGFDVGGIPDMVINGETGFLVPVKDTILLAQRIKEIISNSELRTCFSLKGREHIIEDFSLEKQTKAYIDLYRNLL
jgi:glycosyltransferase involved in cell wall biosynthesis